MSTVGTDERVEGYASALLHVARAEGLVDRVVDELYDFGREFERNDRLRQTLTDQELPPELRQAVIEELLGKKASPVTASLVGFIVGVGRGRYLVQIVERLAELAAAERQREVAEVRSAVALDEEQKARLAESLSKALHKKVDVKVVVDPSLLGGVVARVGDTVIDASVRHRLEKLREVL